MPEEVEDDDTYPASGLEDGNTGGQTDVPDDADGDIENLVADPEPAQSHIAKIFQGEAKAALNSIAACLSSENLEDEDKEKFLQVLRNLQEVIFETSRLGP